MQTQPILRRYASEQHLAVHVRYSDRSSQWLRPGDVPMEAVAEVLARAPVAGVLSWDRRPAPFSRESRAGLPWQPAA